MSPTFLQYNFPTQRGPSEVTLGNALRFLFLTSCGVKIYSIQTPAVLKLKPVVD